MPDTGAENREWRWIDDEDGTHTLVEGKGLLPGPRVVLKCGDIDSEDQDRIAAVPDLTASLAKARDVFRGYARNCRKYSWHSTAEEFEGYARDCDASLAKAIRQVSPNPEG